MYCTIIFGSSWVAKGITKYVLFALFLSQTQLMMRGDFLSMNYFHLYPCAEAKAAVLIIIPTIVTNNAIAIRTPFLNALDAIFAFISIAYL
jgi:hypothetical protein